MTRLEKFKETSKGMALSVVITAALLPFGHRLVEMQVEKETKAEMASLVISQTLRGNPVVFDERDGWQSPYSADIKKFETRRDVLEAASLKMLSRSIKLNVGVQAFAILHDRLKELAEGIDADVSVKEQMQIMSEAIGSGLRAMHRELPEMLTWERAAEAGKARTLEASGHAHGEDERTLAGFKERADKLRDEVQDLADTINGQSSENGVLEAALESLSCSFDSLLAAANLGEEGVDQAREAMSLIETVLNEQAVTHLDTIEIEDAGSPSAGTSEETSSNGEPEAEEVAGLVI